MITLVVLLPSGHLPTEPRPLKKTVFVTFPSNWISSLRVWPPWLWQARCKGTGSLFRTSAPANRRHGAGCPEGSGLSKRGRLLLWRGGEGLWGRERPFIVLLSPSPRTRAQGPPRPAQTEGRGSAQSRGAPRWDRLRPPQDLRALPRISCLRPPSSRSSVFAFPSNAVNCSFHLTGVVNETLWDS